MLAATYNKTSQTFVPILPACSLDKKHAFIVTRGHLAIKLAFALQVKSRNVP